MMGIELPAVNALICKALTAASKTLPLGSSLRVTNLKNGRSTQVKINDRGRGTRPESRLLSAAAQRLAYKKGWPA